MKKILFFLLAVCLVASAFAQTSTSSYKKRPSLALNFFLQDMKTAELLSKSSLSNVLSNKQWAKLKDMDPGLSLQYLEGLTDHTDFMGTVSGSFVDYPFYPKSGVKPAGASKFLLEADAAVNIKLLTDKYFMVPFLSFGVGASMYGGTYFAAYAPAGAGFQFNLGEGIFINTMFTYKAAISNLAVNHLSYSIGIISPLNDRKESPLLVIPPRPAPVTEKDTDGDGIPDSKDKCPGVPGIVKYDGCPVPDTDGDGINDENDKCPIVKGVAQYDGCPIPDRDGDGINDEEDKCPDVPGVARYHGCPVPDRDGDGVNDEEDRCPDVPGVKENHGCPLVKAEIVKQVNSSAKNIFFVTGSDRLLTKSFKSLQAVTAVLKADPALKLGIGGHTDNTGGDKINVPLSKSRAKAVYDFFVKAGIDAARLTSEGYGSGQPVADNKTASGRALNRRVVMILKYY